MSKFSSRIDFEKVCRFCGIVFCWCGSGDVNKTYSKKLFPKPLFQSEAECKAVALEFFFLHSCKQNSFLHLASFWKCSETTSFPGSSPTRPRRGPWERDWLGNGPVSSMLEMFFHLWFSYTHCSQSYEHRALRDDTLKNGCESSAPCLVIFFYGKCLRVPWINCRCDF